MRQGLLSEPKASSGPAALLLAVSRSPSSIPRRSPCPERCHLPLVSLDHIPPPGPMPPSSGVPLHPSHKTSKASPTASTERCHLPLASLDHIHTHKKSPASSYSKDAGLPSVIYKLEMRLELTTPSLRVKCSTA